MYARFDLQIGIYGYTAYAASKFALVGMAQALQMEVSRRENKSPELEGAIALGSLDC